MTRNIRLMVKGLLKAMWGPLESIRRLIANDLFVINPMQDSIISFKLVRYSTVHIKVRLSHTWICTNENLISFLSSLTDIWPRSGTSILNHEDAKSTASFLLPFCSAIIALMAAHVVLWDLRYQVAKVPLDILKKTQSIYQRNLILAIHNDHLGQVE